MLQQLNHETSDNLIQAMEQNRLKHELAPPANHQSNPAEQVIQKFKSHFISVLNGVDKGFPKIAWDYLIPQTNMALNMICRCGIKPAHSAYSYVHGLYDFDAHPLAPLRCRAIVHQRATGRGGKSSTWAN